MHNITVNTFVASNCPEDIKEDHENVCNFLGLDVSYHTINYDNFDETYRQHGEFIENILKNSLNTLEIFLDIDCIPHNLKSIKESMLYVYETGTFCGNAQNVSHVKDNTPYASPSFLIVSTSYYRSLACPTLTPIINGETHIDTAQNLTAIATKLSHDYKLLYPLGSFYKEWDLIPGHQYGVGTVYPGTYHHFKLVRETHDIELWKTMVKNILDGKELNGYKEF